MLLDVTGARHPTVLRGNEIDITPPGESYGAASLNLRPNLAHVSVRGAEQLVRRLVRASWQSRLLTIELRGLSVNKPRLALVEESHAMKQFEAPKVLGAAPNRIRLLSVVTTRSATDFLARSGGDDASSVTCEDSRVG